MVKRSTIWLSLCLFALCAFGQGAFLQHRRTASRPPPSSATVATKFTPSTDYLTHSGALTGAADSKLLTISFWMKLNDAAQNATDRMLYHSDGVVRFMAENGTHDGASVANDLFFDAQDAGFAHVLTFVTTSTFTAGSTWHHIAISVDLANSAKRFVYVDGATATPSWSAYVNSAMAWSSAAAQGIVAQSDGASPTAGSFYDIWIGYGQYLDISVASNLQKFRTAGGVPANLGSDGSTPTGTAPTIYLKGPASLINVNSGSGGNFTIHGTPVDDLGP